jgi:hypothetical protein
MPGPRRRIAFLVRTCLLASLSTAARADDFDRLGEVDLSRPVLQQHARKVDGLGFRDLAALPAVLRDARTSLLIVVTDQGNVARLVASPGFRKAPDDPNKLTPTLVLDRFETRDPANRSAPAARGKEVWLFDGFGYDLDAGQVVPADMGADIRFVAAGPDDGRLSPVGKAEMLAVETLPPVPKASADRPSEGRVVRTSDYAGRFRLAANGVWSGLLELKVDAEGVVSGDFQSDAGGAARPVTGKAAAGGDHGIAFTISFPRTKQEYTGWLWGEGKNVIAGSVTMINQTFSFVAIREGATASLASLGLKLAGPTSDRQLAHTLALYASGEQFLLDAVPTGRPISDLPSVLAELLKAEPDASIVVKAPGAIAFERVRRFVQTIEDAGARSIRLAPGD